MSQAREIRDRVDTLPAELVARYFAGIRTAGCTMDIRRIELRVFPADDSELNVQMLFSEGEVKIVPLLVDAPTVY